MNKLFKLLLLCAFSVFLPPAQAQDLSRNPQLQQRILQAKLTEIQSALALSDGKMKELAPIYSRYEEEKNAIRFPKQGRLLRTSLDSLSTEEADKLVTAQLDNAVKMSTIRRKYYTEFKTVLTPQQVVQLYRSEAQLNKKVMQELRRRLRSRANQ